ncbi:COX6A-domain-containing protein [Jackrogersella minutella]|nr:COX6A-domain-containing protein [Jackrogersella minutella]
MLPQRQILRAAPRLTAQLRAANAPVFRSTLQRRLASTENAFVKEREAVKHHAAATTELWRKISIYPSNAYLSDKATYIMGICCTGLDTDKAFKEDDGTTLNENKNNHPANKIPHASAVIPALILASVNAYNQWNEHWEHWEHLPPLEERVEYPYQNIRTKNFSWGDGDKTIFWNDKVNYHKKDKTT